MNNMKKLQQSIRFFVAIVPLVGGCADEFDSYEQVVGPRLLAIGADRPELAPGDSTTFRTLVTAPATHRWSWCPFVGRSEDGYPCLLQRQQLQVLADATLGPGDLVVPVFDLGTGETASFTHEKPWLELCEALVETGDGALALLECDVGFELTIRVEVLFADGAQITAVRELVLLRDGVPPNQNPQIGDVFADGIVVAEEGSSALAREREYALRLDIGADQAETYESRPIDGSEPMEISEDLDSVPSALVAASTSACSTARFISRFQSVKTQPSPSLVGAATSIWCSAVSFPTMPRSA